MIYFIDLEQSSITPLNLSEHWENHIHYSPKITSYLLSKNIISMSELISFSYQELIFDSLLSDDDCLEIISNINHYLTQNHSYSPDSLYYPSIFCEREKEISLKLFEELPVRAFNMLNKKNITNVKEALDFIFFSLEKEKGIGQESIYLAKISAIKLVRTISNYTNEVFFSIINDSVLFVENKPHFLEMLPEILDKFIEYIYKNSQKERNIDILFKRYGFANQNNMTLEDIGKPYGLTRERIRQIINKMKDNFLLFLNGESKSKYRLHTSIVEKFNQEIITLKARKFITIDYFNNVKVNIAYIEFFMDLLNYEFISNAHLYTPLTQAFYSQLHRNEIDAIIDKIKLAFYDKYKSFTLDEIYAFIEENRINTINKEDLFILIENIKNIEENNGYYSIKTESLNSIADITYRIFLDENRKLSISEIADIIEEKYNHKEKYKRASLTRGIPTQLSADPRFTPMGKSGIWALSEWKVENKTIKELMVEALTESDLLTEAEIFHYVKNRRKVASNSITVYLAENIFIKENNRFRLRREDEQVEEKEKKRMPTDLEFYELILAFFNKNADNHINKNNDEEKAFYLIDLIKYILNHSSLKEPTIRQKLSCFDGKFIESYHRDNQLKKFVKLLPVDADSLPLDTRKNLRWKIQNEVIAILSTMDKKEITKNELYRELSKKLDCIKQTFYQYLSDMDNIKQYKKEGKYYVSL